MITNPYIGVRVPIRLVLAVEPDEPVARKCEVINPEKLSYITRCEIAGEIRSAVNTHAYTVGF